MILFINIITMKTTKKYYINNMRVTKKDFEGYLYLLFCRLTNKGRDELMNIMKKQNEQYNFSKNTLDDAIIKSLEYKD